MGSLLSDNIKKFKFKKEFFNYKMSESSETESLISNSLSSQSTDSDYIPSQTPETEDYTSYESSEPLTPTESEYSTDSEYSLSSSLE